MNRPDHWAIVSRVAAAAALCVKIHWAHATSGSLFLLVRISPLLYSLLYSPLPAMAWLLAIKCSRKLCAARNSRLIFKRGGQEKLATRG